MRYSHKPDISVRLAPRMTRKAKSLVDQTCRRYEMFEADVLRLCLEAIVPVVAKRGMAWLTGAIPDFKRNIELDLPSMVTVRTSRRIKDMIDSLTANRKYTEVEVLRYCYDYILPIALEKGFAKIMAMREKNLSAATARGETAGRAGKRRPCPIR